MLEVRDVRLGGSVATVVAVDTDSGVTYGVACDPRMAQWVLDELRYPGTPPPSIHTPEPWEILWTTDQECEPYGEETQ